MEILDHHPSEGHIESPRKFSTTGKFLVGITGGVALGLTLVCAPFVSPALRKFCLPYVPATTKQVENIFQALAGHKGNLIDLGSGDGRIVIEAAKRGYFAHGVELNPWLVLYSKINSIKHGVKRNTKFFCSDLWKFGLNKYDNVVIFGVEQMMADLEKKFLEECPQQCNVIACRFPLPNFVPVRTIGKGIDTVWIYNMPKGHS